MHRVAGAGMRQLEIEQWRVASAAPARASPMRAAVKRRKPVQISFSGAMTVQVFRKPVPTFRDHA